MPPPTEITQRPERVLDFIVLDAIMEEENTQTQSNSAPVVDIGALNPIRYRGYYYDVETGWYWLQTRYYNPEWRRFINADVLFIAGCVLTAVNMYAYCNGNPVMLVDPSGMSAEQPGPIALFILTVFAWVALLEENGLSINQITVILNEVGDLLERIGADALTATRHFLGLIENFLTETFTGVTAIFNYSWGIELYLNDQMSKDLAYHLNIVVISGGVLDALAAGFGPQILSALGIVVAGNPIALPAFAIAILLGSAGLLANAIEYHNNGSGVVITFFNQPIAAILGHGFQLWRVRSQ